PLIDGVPVPRRELSDLDVIERRQRHQPIGAFLGVVLRPGNGRHENGGAERKRHGLNHKLDVATHWGARLDCPSLSEGCAGSVDSVDSVAFADSAAARSSALAALRIFAIARFPSWHAYS